MRKTYKLDISDFNKEQLLSELNKNYILFLECELELKDCIFKEMVRLKKQKETISKLLNKILINLRKFKVITTIEDIRSKKINILEL